MSGRRKKVRKIIFGIRFKFSLVMIIAVVFVSILLGLALYHQHEKKFQDAMLRLGATTLKGAADAAHQYLQYTHLLDSEKAKHLSRYQRSAIEKRRRDALIAMGQYFSAVIKKEKILDISFLIDIRWRDIDVDWKKRNQSKYYYFNRENGTLFTQGSGRNDPLLEPTILAHYMQHVDTKTYLTFTDLMDDEKFEYLFKKIKRDYLVVGIPIFHQIADASLYDGYNRFKKASRLSRDEIQVYFKRRDQFFETFTKRIIDHGLTLDYGIMLKTDREKKLVVHHIVRALDISRLGSTQKSELGVAIITLIAKGMHDDTINLSEIKSIVNSVRKKYKIPFRAISGELNIWQNLFYFLKRNRIEISIPQSLDELALLSYRKDIAGVLGLFLQRYQFFSEMKQNRDEIINLMLSILLRTVFIALLIPTFLIRSISTLADGALEIGKGNFDTRIELKGTDELGRLADTFNIMAGNLQKAQELKIEKYRMENELITAQHIQAALLPERLPSIAGLECGAYYSTQTESGGDYYDFIELENNLLGIAIADVSGHGVASALVMAMTRTLLHIYCRSTNNTKTIFEHINKYLKENTESYYFVTMFYGILNLDTLQLTFSSAGHNQGIILRDNSLQEIPAGGIALGVTDDSTFSELTDIRKKTLQRGDYFIQFTDGVNEAVDAEGNEFGMERFYQALLANDGKSPQEMINGVMDSLHNFIGDTTQDDDITIIILRIT
jgi:serine phosphatase RsbU (regulator of sigma subunit)